MTRCVGGRIRLAVALVVVACLIGYVGYLRGQAAQEPVVVVVEQPADPKHDDRARDAIRHVLDAQVAAWNKGDLKGFMAGYWRSAELEFFSGKDVTRGWQATLERYQKRYQSERKEMGKLTFRNLDVHVTGPTSGWVSGRWQLVTSKGKPGGLFTLIFKKFPEGWRIIHDHTSGGES